MNPIIDVHTKPTHYIVKTMLVALFIFSIIGIIRYTDWRNSELVIKKEADLTISSVSSLIQQKIDEEILITDALAALVLYNNEPTEEEFNRFTAFFAQHNKELISLQLAPDGIVTYVTDPLRNRAAIGHNLLEGERSRVSALRAIETGEKIAVGPIDLIQGGRALIVRNPIYNVDGGFWGFATVLIDFETLIKEHLTIEQLTYIDIYSLDENGNKGEPLFGNKRDLPVLAKGSIEFGPNKWSIYVNDIFRTFTPVSFVLSDWFWLFSSLISFIIILLSYKVFKTKDDLEKAVRESTESLSKTLLQLEQENEKRNQLYGMIAHELRTPLSVINMISYDDDLDWSATRTDIQQHSDILLDTLNDMRMVINPNLERESRISTFRIHDLMDYISKANNSIVTSNQFSMQSKLLPSQNVDKMYTSDVYRIRIALSNLIRNACLHSEGDKVKLEYSIITEGTDTKLIIDVSDNGKGIPESKRSTIFDPGVRGETNAPGTGLGLAIARNWLREIDGDLNLIHSLNGSTFRIEVPIKLAGDNIVDEELDDVIEKLSGLKVLIVEDDNTLRMLGSKLIEKYVKHVAVEPTPLHALAHAPSDSNLTVDDYDIIITDYYMPDMNGDEFIKRLVERNFKGRIVGLTAATLGDQVDSMYANGAHAVMFKPMTAKSFLQTAKKILK